MRAAPIAALALLAACASGAKEEPGRPLPPDARALGIETRVVARSVRIVLSERWRERADISGLRIARPDDRTVVAEGEARFRLLGYDVRAQEELRVTWRPAAHENFLLYAQMVEDFRQQRGYSIGPGRTTMLTIADEQVSWID